MPIEKRYIIINEDNANRYGIEKSSQKVEIKTE
jgi:hypothetical protein